MDKTWPIVTLTSDFGWRDYHVALLKASLLREQRRLHLVDITHDIPNYDIVQGAFLFQNAWRAFPKGSIHIVSVNDFYQADSRFVALEQGGHYFIGPDNGIFYLVFGQTPKEAYYLDIPRSGSPDLKALYAKAVSHIVREKPFYEIGMPVKSLTERLALQPVIGQDYIRGSVIYIDKFENATLNISRDLFERVGEGRPFSLFFKRHEPITVLSSNFHDVAEGEPLCRFNMAGYLEIAINMGRAASLFGLQMEDTVQVDFHS